MRTGRTTGAAFALGREHIIPAMFRALLAKMGIDAKTAPTFHFYLERHIHLAEAQAAARAAVQARIGFWDGVKTALK